MHCASVYRDQMSALRRRVHRRPEEGWTEFETTALIVSHLRSLQFEVRCGRAVIHPDFVMGRDPHLVAEAVARAKRQGVSEELLSELDDFTGAVGIWDSGRPGPVTAFRFDIDCVQVGETSDPAHEANAGGYASERPNLMHACGHDGHTTMLLAAARYLSQHRNFRGRVVLVFQPAEEGTGGALAMIKDGLFERFPMDEIYGMHNWTDVEPGTFSVKSGAAMAGSDFFTIKLHGKGAHGSAPQLSADAALAASLVTVALQQIVARNVAPLDSAVVSVTKIHTGSAFNIIPQEAELGGCTRFFSSATGALLRRRIEEVAVSTAAACGVNAEVEFESIYAVLDNVPQLAEAMKKAAVAVVGEAKTQWAANPQMGSEDFSFMLEKVPGAYCFLGGQAPHGAANLHNPSFDFDDRVLPTGAAIWVELAMERLAV